MAPDHPESPLVKTVEIKLKRIVPTAGAELVVKVEDSIVLPM